MMNGPEGCVEVRVNATRSEGMQTYGNFGKRPDYTGNRGECRGMIRTT